MKNHDIPCCAADAVRSVRPGEVNGATAGLSMLDPVVAGVRALADDAAVQAELLKQVKVYNYVPPPAADACAVTENREYARWNRGDTP